MLKQTAFILGLGAALSLTACAQSGTGASDPVQGKQTTSQPATSESARDGQRPEGRRPGGREGRTPPEAAFAACASVAVGASCSFETLRGTRSGTCRSRSSNDRAICAVAHLDGARRPRRSGE